MMISLPSCHLRSDIGRLVHEVLLWIVDLDQYAAAVDFDGLSASEVEAAQRKVFERDYIRSLASRHALRRALGSVVGRPPAELRIGIDAWGRPALVDGGEIDFNVSHSEQFGLIGLSRGPSVGVDIEAIRPIADAAEIARVHFSEGERAELAAGSPSIDRDFLSCWTRKEACLKALGVGLSGRPSAFNAGCTPGARSVYVALGDRQCESVVTSVDIPFEAVAAVAVTERANIMIARRAFPP